MHLYFCFKRVIVCDAYRSSNIRTDNGAHGNSAVVNDLIATRTVIAFPNPAKASDDITVAYKAKQGVMIDKAEIEIYTMNGDRVAKVTETTDRNGIVKFPLSKFAPGLYLYKVTVSYADGSKDSHKLKKFVVVR